jgi:hypothetical protein
MEAISQTRGLGAPLPKVWTLYQASLQAIEHRTYHNDLHIDAMCCISQVEGASVAFTRCLVACSVSAENDDISTLPCQIIAACVLS